MRIPVSHQHSREHDDAFMTPMIDVVFLLLIFFVVASTGQVRESSLPTPLSAPGSVEATDAIEDDVAPSPVWVRLMRIGEGETATTAAEIDNQRYDDWNTLRGILREFAAIAPDNPVILDIEHGVPVGDFVDIYDTCRSAGFENIQFATAPQPSA